MLSLSSRAWETFSVPFQLAPSFDYILRTAWKQRRWGSILRSTYLHSCPHSESNGSCSNSSKGRHRALRGTIRLAWKSAWDVTSSYQIGNMHVVLHDSASSLNTRFVEASMQLWPWCFSPEAFCLKLVCGENRWNESLEAKVLPTIIVGSKNTSNDNRWKTKKIVGDPSVKLVILGI